MAKNGKLPKRIAGVKIPKKLRKKGAPLYELLNQPMVRNVVADVIAAGLLAAADAMAKHPDAKKAGRAAKRKAENAADVAEADAVNVGQVLAFIARESAQAIKSR
jgi:hypothetical protein